MKTDRAAYDVFISHSARDGELARDIARRLRAAGLEPFLGVEKLRPGGDWAKWRDIISNAKAVLLLVTRTKLESPWTMSELGLADALGKVIVPVVAGVGEEPLPEPLQAYQTVPYDRLDEAIEELTQKLAGSKS